MTDPTHITSGVQPFVTDDSTDEQQYRVLELGLQGMSDDSALTLAAIEASLTYERRSDIQASIAREYFRAEWATLSDKQKAEIQAALMSPFA